MGNPVTHWQILSTQPDRLEAFYETLFGWRVSADNPLGYRTVDTQADAGIHGGIWPVSPTEGRSLVQLFIRVDDVDACVRRAVELGGRVVVPRQVLPRGDEMAVVVDPDGLPFAVFRGAGAHPA
jgi:predicted enzyme related to lactoylglutathione lyase